MDTFTGTVLFESHDLLTDGASVESEYIRLSGRGILINKHSEGATYTMALDWSVDGGSSSALTTYPELQDSVTLAVTRRAPWVKITISASEGDFTEHVTVVTATNR